MTIFVRLGIGGYPYLVIFSKDLIKPRIAPLKGSACVVGKRVTCSVIVLMFPMGMVGRGPVSGTLDPTLAEAHSAAASSVPAPPPPPSSSDTAVHASPGATVEFCDEGFAPVLSSSQSQSILTGLVSPTPESSIGAFSSSVSVMSDTDSPLIPFRLRTIMII